MPLLVSLKPLDPVLQPEPVRQVDVVDAPGEACGDGRLPGLLGRGLGEGAGEIDQVGLVDGRGPFIAAFMRFLPVILEVLVVAFDAVEQAFAPP
jgi:hypothetical protein